MRSKDVFDAGGLHCVCLFLAVQISRSRLAIYISKRLLPDRCNNAQRLSFEFHLARCKRFRKMSDILIQQQL